MLFATSLNYKTFVFSDVPRKWSMNQRVASCWLEIIRGSTMPNWIGCGSLWCECLSFAAGLGLAVCLERSELLLTWRKVRSSGQRTGDSVHGPI